MTLSPFFTLYLPMVVSFWKFYAVVMRTGGCNRSASFMTLLRCSRSVTKEDGQYFLRASTVLALSSKPYSVYILFSSSFLALFKLDLVVAKWPSMVCVSKLLVYVPAIIKSSSSSIMTSLIKMSGDCRKSDKTSTFCSTSLSFLLCSTKLFIKARRRSAF